ncbi:MAG: hypothetical protein IJJ65_09035 [Butyrivibrio sp.]|nr:hypothetical protein [Butyrivibrio sp.]
MRFTHALGGFIIIAICIALPMFIDTDFNTSAQNSTRQYSEFLQSATDAGVKAAYQYIDDGLLFSSELSRQAAVDAYYKLLEKNFNYEFGTSADLVKYYTPCIFLIDNDGFYIEYTETYSDSGYSTYTDVITPINKWSARYGDYYVEFHLDNSVKIVYDNAIYEGDYSEVFLKLESPHALQTGDSSPNPELPDFSADEETFAQVRYEYIINIVQDKLEYYVNTHQEFFNQKGNVQYAFTLPKITGDDWGRLLDAPTILGFLQGIQVPHTNSFINVYAFTGNELTETQKYYIAYDIDFDLNYYHTAKHAKALGLDMEDQIGYSMEGAAKQGAHPCPECILQRY